MICNNDVQSVNCCVRQPEKRPKCRSWGKAKHGVGTSGRGQKRTTKIEKRQKGKIMSDKVNYNKN